LTGHGGGGGGEIERFRRGGKLKVGLWGGVIRFFVVFSQTNELERGYIFLKVFELKSSSLKRELPYR